MDFVTYNAASLTYTVAPGAATSDIQSLLKNAAKGTIFQFTEGTHTFTGTLRLATDNVTIRGAGQDKTTFVFDYAGTPGHGIQVGNTGYKDDWQGTVTKTVKTGATTITLDDASKLQAGDLILVRQKNSRKWLDDNGYKNVPDEYVFKTPINESLVEVKAVNGNVVTLAQPITHDMNALDTTNMTTTVRLIDATYDVTLADFAVKFKLGESDPDSMSNKKPGYENVSALHLEQTVDANVQNVSVDEAPSTSLEFHTSLRPYVDRFSADGAHNKGSSGAGYGLHISETHYGTFKNLTITDTRHAVVFSSWHTDVANEVHILSTNRDINYHGGPDYDNVVIVEQAIYREGSDVWPLVSPGDYHHPKTDIDANTTVFGVAQATSLGDKFHGWNKGAWLDGAGGNDIIYGGTGNDILIGGKGSDDIYLEGGNDVIAFRPGGSTDDIFGFGSGDKILIDNFSGVSAFSHVGISNVSGGVQIKAGGETIAVLRGLSASALSAANFLFNDDSYFIPPGTASPPDPPPPPPSDGLILTTGADNIAGTSGSDTVSTWLSQLNSGDKIALGSGSDILLIRNGSLTFDSGTYPLLSGIDILDVRAASNAQLTIRDGLVDGSDKDILTIAYSRTIKLLDTGAVQPGHKVVLDGTGVVNLSAKNDTISLANGVNGKIYGKEGNDRLYGGDGADNLFGGAGKDLLQGGKGADHLSGGGSGDVFRYTNALEGGDIIEDYASGDIIDLSELFAGNGLGGKTLAQAKVDGNLLLKQNGADAVISFDADGTGGAGLVILATLRDTSTAGIAISINPVSI